jgi:hypothetical protein
MIHLCGTAKRKKKFYELKGKPSQPWFFWRRNINSSLRELISWVVAQGDDSDSVFLISQGDILLYSKDNVPAILYNDTYIVKTLDGEYEMYSPQGFKQRFNVDKI